MQADERRRSQRLRLSKPILATMLSSNALILDIGIGGAFLEHYGTVQSGDRFNLAFRWQGSDVELVCEVARSFVVKTAADDGKSTVSHTGVRFLEAVGDSHDKLRDLMATFVGHIFEAQRANAAGVGVDSAGATILAQLGGARRMRSRRYVTCELTGNVWRQTPTDSPAQPLHGFTVGDHEDEADLEKLCRAYERSDAEGRNLIRLLAELSLNIKS